MSSSIQLDNGAGSTEAMPIAIVGMGCRLPGGASNPEKLWDLLTRKQSARKETPPDRFNIDAFYHPNADKNGTMNNRAGHYLEEDISAFDAPFFSISPAEAISMDPMQRILLEVAYEAMESAGIPINSLAGSDTSCFVGCFTSDYDQIAKRDPETLPKYHSVGTGQAILSNRLSFYFDLKGPSVTLDTACSSSLVAVHLACQSLRTGESKTAVVGATHAILNPDIQVGMTNLHFLSPDSRCHTFDSRANGYARGEGMAALILKPLSDAIRDGDTIRAVIRGTAVNSNGKNPGITLPSREAQVRLIQSAYEQAGCDPSQTGYCEAHGTGTAAGDPLEASAIGDALGAHRPDGEENKLYVGSIKTNIGHLEGASGLAGIVKAVMSVERGFIAPNLWFEKGNPAIDFDAWRIRVPTEVIPWPMSGLRRASVNGFGYGGTNGHVIIDDAYHFMKERGLSGKHMTAKPEPPFIIEENLMTGSVSDISDDESASVFQRSGINTPSSDESVCSDPSGPETRPRVFFLSGHENESILNNAKAYAAHLTAQEQGNEEQLLDDLAFTLGERRSRFDYGSAVVASTKEELIEGLESLPNAVRRNTETPELAFVFTGQGAQWWAMGRELLQYPVFFQSLAACNEALQSFGCSWSLSDELQKDKRSSRINEAEISQPVCSAVQIGLVDLYASWNVHPNKVVGHSSGEIAAAYATGALSLESSMRVAFFRGLLSPKIKTLGYKGGMMAAGLSEEDAVEEIKSMDSNVGKAAVACVNSPKSVTLSGDLSTIAHLQRTLTSRGVFARKLQVETAYHSHHMLAIAEEYREKLADLEVVPWAERKSVTMHSSVTARTVTADDSLAGEYWVENMVSCVRFSAALTDLCSQGNDENAKSATILFELGPHAALAGPVKQILSSMLEPGQEATSIQYFSALVREQDAAVTALKAASSLFMQGYPVNLNTANFAHATHKSSLSVLADLPTYSWNHSRKYWAESRLSRDHRFRPFARTDILGAPSNDWNPIEPRWRNFIRLSEQPWVRSHVVQGAIIYPAAGFCCMALEAAKQMHTLASRSQDAKTTGPIAEYKIRDFIISRALVVPEAEEGVEVTFSMRPDPTATSTESVLSWNEFRIFSYTEANGWAEHCRGSVALVYRDETEAASKIDAKILAGQVEAKEACNAPVASSKLYAGLDAAGLFYGPEFQGIVDVLLGPGHALGTVEVTDTASGMPLSFEFDRIIHPATMDTFLQMTIAAVTQGNISNLTQPFVPVSVQDISVSGKITAPAGQKLQVSANAQKHGTRGIRASVTAVAEDTGSMIRMSGVQLVAIASSAEDGEVKTVANHTAVAVWEPDVDLLEMTKMNDILQSSSTLDHNSSRLKDLEMLAYYFFEKVMDEMKDVDVNSLHPHHQKFWRYMQHQRDMVLSNTHEQQNAEWSNLNEPQTVARLEELMDRLTAEGDYEGQMFVRMGNALASVLRKEVEPLALMMKDNLLYNYYTVSLGTQGTYPQIAKYVSMLSHKYPDLEYLEIGAGTGGCTTPVLQALSGAAGRDYPRMKSYTYTDISSGFFEQAAAKFSDWKDMMEFAKLDIEQDPVNQSGFENRQFDVIIAANVLHATYDIQRTIKHTRKLLRPGGKLILLDMTHSMMAVSLIFGNLPGWWNCSESWREYGPLLDEEQWRDVLLNQGFSDLQASSADVLDPLEEQTRVIVASAVEHVVQVKNTTSPPHVLLIGPDASSENAMVQTTKTKLNDAGITTTCCTLTDSQTRDLAGTAVISFAELDEGVLLNISDSDLTALQRLLSDSTGLVWVTRGGSASKGTRPELALFQGMARSLRAEREGVPCVSLDLDAETPLPTSDAVDLIVKVFEQSFGLAVGADFGLSDREFTEERGVLQIKRAIENTQFNELIATQTQRLEPKAELQDIFDSDRNLQVRIGTDGKLESLVFDDATDIGELADDHVEVSVHAVNLSSRDALIATGELSDEKMGSECAGIVTRIGRNVAHVVVGDRVAVWSVGSAATVVHCAAQSVQKIPDSFDFPSAAALPKALVTAYYSLVYAARIREGDSVLIYSAADATGRMAIQIANSLGARVFATVDSDEKKELLRRTRGVAESNIFSSQDLEFTSAIKQAIGGRGVDVILNTLEGEAAQESWGLVAPFGRFIELGDGNLDSKMLQSKNVIVAAVDAMAILKQDQKLAGELFSKAMELVAAGRVVNTVAPAVKPFSEIQDALCQILVSKSDENIVLEARAGDLVPVMPKPREHIKFHEDASYLLAGGFGGLGRSMSRWMVQNGARNLIFVSRGGASSAEASELVEELSSKGANITVLKCDITDEAVFTSSLAQVLETLPPIKGVVQAAMVLKDQVFSNMSHNAFKDCVQPKVQGSWSLHKATLQQPLDFFLLLSSCASFWGNAGQSNYAAGCNYQVALAAHRRGLGLPAAAIDIGKVANVGFVAENAGTTSERNLIKLGLVDVHEDELLTMLGVAMLPPQEGDLSMSNGHLLTGVHSINDPMKGAELPFWSRDPVFSHMDFVRPHIHKAKQIDDATDASAKEQQPLPTLLASAASAKDAAAYVLDALIRKLARSLMMNHNDIDAKRPMAAYGVDSLIAVELRNWFAREGKVEMPVFEILQAASLTALASKAAGKSALVKLTT